MIISHIVAMSENRVIGVAGGIPWHIPQDFKFFKQTTMGHAMIMGRKTWASIGRALPGRLTIVVSRDHNLKLPEGVILKASVEAAINYCESVQNKWGHECFIVGGGDIYRQTLPLTNRIYLTTVHKHIEGDTTYPEFSKSTFKELNSDSHLDAPIPFTFSTWVRTD
jgi:dihydrofolate reductase